MSEIYEHGYRLWSNQSLPDRLVVETDVNDQLVITVDDVDYTVTLPEGNYDTSYNGFFSKLITSINNQLDEMDAPVRVRLGGIHDDEPRVVIVFETTDKTFNGKHSVINEVNGSMVADIISEEAYDVEEPILKEGAEEPDPEPEDGGIDEPLPPEEEEDVEPEPESPLEDGEGMSDLNSEIGVPGYDRADMYAGIEISNE
jgi:hypothetical protein